MPAGELKIKNAFRPHAEQEVEDAEIWQESMLVLEHLPISFSLEVRVVARVLGADDFAEVGGDG